MNLTKTENIIDEINKNKIIAFIIIFLFLVIASILTAFQKKEYSSTAEILIIQEQEDKMDAYIASKSAEAIARNLKIVMSTNSFRNKVLKDLETIKFYNYQNEKKKREQWVKSLKVRIIPNTSILRITFYYQSTFETEKILNKILEALLKNHQEYHGGADNIKLKIINDPLTSTHFTKPNWFLNLFLTLILAIFFIITLISLFPNKINQMNKKIKKIKFKRTKQEINEKKGYYKVFDYLSNPPQNNIKLPTDLFVENNSIFETKNEEKIEGFFEKDLNYNIQEKKHNSNRKRKEINESKTKQVIDHTHYLKKKE